MSDSLAGPWDVDTKRYTMMLDLPWFPLNLMFSLELFDQTAEAFQLARSWFVAQPIPLKLVSGAAAFAVLWVLWILLRVILVALRAAFRGL